MLSFDKPNNTVSALTSTATVTPSTTTTAATTTTATTTAMTSTRGAWWRPSCREADELVVLQVAVVFVQVAYVVLFRFRHNHRRHWGHKAVLRTRLDNYVIHEQ